jgi:nucleotide-binding universal stress UspA family protein
MRRILIATDGSDHALKAAHVAGELAASVGAELHILAVAYRDRRELQEFARIEQVEGGIADVARSVLPEIMWSRRDEEPRRKAP